MSTFVKNLDAATKNSWQGLRYALRTQWAFQMELAALIVAIPLVVVLARSIVESVLLIGSILLMMMVELLNTAVETTVNRIGVEYHELSGLAKDLGSAAVFISIANTLIIWGMILFNRF